MEISSTFVFSSLRMRRSPPSDAFLAPVEISEVLLLQTLISLANELVSSFSGKSLFFQRRNCRSLVRRIEVFAVLLESLKESEVRLSPTMVVCLKELHLLLYRSKMLLDYCVQSSKLWLLLQNQSVSGYFHDLNQEMLTLIDVFPSGNIELSVDIREQIDLLQRQTRRSRLFIDKNDESLKAKLFWILNEFENGRTPDEDSLRFFFIESLKIKSAARLRAEIEFLEEQIMNHDGDIEPTAAVLNAFVAIARYSRFLLFGFHEDEAESTQVRQMEQAEKTPETCISIPKDFLCPISLDMMKDPVIVSTGQTYDRSSISRWVEEGHCSCPKTGQVLMNTRLVSNLALKNLIMHWCAANGVPYEHSDTIEPGEQNSLPLPTNAANEANKSTVSLLVHQLGNGSPRARTVAAREVRMLAKTGKENRALIAEAGAIPLLCNLLSSPDPVAQENSVTAMLNLSIYDKNKARIMEEEGCLKSIVDVLNRGMTTEARENAAATLFSLSAVHDNKKIIANENGAVEALTELLRAGTSRGKKDAVTALFNLSTHHDNRERIVEAGAVSALVGALTVDGVAEEAAGALALIVKQPAGAEAVAREEAAVSGLIGMMRGGSPRGKENAVAALLELCRSGGASTAERVLRAPALAGLLQSLLYTGTKRARRKAASLARVFQRGENFAYHLGFSGGSAASRDSSFVGVSISVPVL